MNFIKYHKAKEQERYNVIVIIIKTLLNMIKHHITNENRDQYSNAQYIIYYYKTT